MADEVQHYDGGCACSAVRFRATGKPKWVSHCHCRDCRRNTGTALVTWAGFPAERFAVTAGTPHTFHSSPGVVRRFCGACGTPLTYEGARWPTEIHLHVGAFDDPEPFAPQGHAFAEERVSWLHLDPPPPPET